VATDHPLSPIYEAVALVKQDVDEVLAERDAREQRLRELARRVEASARAKSVFMASMSHEIRTPMNGVLGLLDLLAEDELTQQQLSMVRAAREGARSLMSLLGGLLDLSELEAGKIALQEADFDLLQVVEEAAALTAPLARAKGLEFNTRVSPRLPARLRGDQARLQQLLANLASEAVKSTEEGGITIRVRSAGTLNGPGTTSLRFEVIYTGAQASEQPCLFAVADRPAEMAPLPGSGTGTGLTICRLLAELMGGELGVKSEQKAGAAFWFTAVFKDAARV
jgi:two-component system, sensor histidine kinase and response regulator